MHEKQEKRNSSSIFSRFVNQEKKELCNSEEKRWEELGKTAS